jgi:hypothetical protein
MNRVRVRNRLRFCTHPARYLTFVGVILIKMARASAEGAFYSIIS